MGRFYEAQMSFTHPGVSRRFRQHVVYELDDDVVELLAPAIERGRLRPLSPDEVAGYTRQVRPGGQATTDGGSGGAGSDDSEQTGSSLPAAAKDPEPQDRSGEGDGAPQTPPDDATTPPSPASEPEA